MHDQEDSFSDESTDPNIRDRFAISPLMDLEIDVGEQGWVGLAAGTSHTLRVNVTAAVIAERVGYASVDYVRRRYGNKVTEHVQRDSELRNLLRRHENKIDKFYRSFVPPRTDAPPGIFAFDLAMVRSNESIRLLLTTARQGFLIEPCLIARSLVEQFAYAVYVWDKVDEKDIFKSRPQSLIKYLKPICPNIGRAYGALSELSHYNPENHYNFIGDRYGETVNQRSWRFKIAATAWTFFIVNLRYIILKNAYGKYKNFSELLKNLDGSTLMSFDRHFEGISDPITEEVRSLIS